MTEHVQLMAAVLHVCVLGGMQQNWCTIRRELQKSKGGECGLTITTVIETRDQGLVWCGVCVYMWEGYTKKLLYIAQ